eukprot:scaffold707_cov399-Prasinococcus_capsulatus_cf.AAC.40
MPAASGAIDAMATVLIWVVAVRGTIGGASRRVSRRGGQSIKVYIAAASTCHNRQALLSLGPQGSAPDSVASWGPSHYQTVRESHVVRPGRAEGSSFAAPRPGHRGRRRLRRALACPPPPLRASSAPQAERGASKPRPKDAWPAAPAGGPGAGKKRTTDHRSSRHGRGTAWLFARRRPSLRPSGQGLLPGGGGCVAAVTAPSKTAARPTACPKERAAVDKRCVGRCVARARRPAREGLTRIATSTGGAVPLSYCIDPGRR